MSGVSLEERLQSDEIIALGSEFAVPVLDDLNGTPRAGMARSGALSAWVSCVSDMAKG